MKENEPAHYSSPYQTSRETPARVQIGSPQTQDNLRVCGVVLQPQKSQDVIGCCILMTNLIPNGPTFFSLPDSINTYMISHYRNASRRWYMWNR